MAKSAIAVEKRQKKMKGGLLTRNTDYAVRALCAMALRPGELFTVTGLSGLTGVPLPYLRRILQSLSREGILVSSRGRGGGFRLVRDPESLTILGLARLFQGEVHLASCLLGGKKCPNIGNCPLHRRLESLEAVVFRELEGLTIADLVSGMK